MKSMRKSSKGTTVTTLVEPIDASGAASMEPKIIKVSPETHKKLVKLGGKGETFDQVIQRLIKEHEERND
jgi:hypothetical protein